MSSEWRNTSVKIVLILFVVCIMIFAFSFVHHTTYTGKSFAEAYDLPVGQSMFAGDSILDQREMIEVPLLSNPGFINKAPESKVNEEKEKLENYKNMLNNVEERLKSLK